MLLALRQVLTQLIECDSTSFWPRQLAGSLQIVPPRNSVNWYTGMVLPAVPMHHQTLVGTVSFAMLVHPCVLLLGWRRVGSPLWMPNEHMHIVTSMCPDVSLCEVCTMCSVMHVSELLSCGMQYSDWQVLSTTLLLKRLCLVRSSISTAQ